MNLTPLQQDERDAMCLDRQAILRVVSALRGYRALVQKLIARRYRDGFTELGFTSDEVEELEGGALEPDLDSSPPKGGT